MTATFDDAVIGTARDDLRNCIDDQLNSLASNFGLDVDNVAVPEVILSPDVQAGLDEIVRKRLQTEQAVQEQLRAKAEADAEQARQEGEIRVEQSRIQEESRQQLTLAKLEEDKIFAQKAVIEAERANELARVEAERAIIEAEKSNALLAAESDLEIERAPRPGGNRTGQGRSRHTAGIGRTLCAQSRISAAADRHRQRQRDTTQRQDHLHPGGHHPDAGHAGTGNRPDD